MVYGHNFVGSCFHECGLQGRTMEENKKKNQFNCRKLIQLNNKFFYFGAVENKNKVHNVHNICVVKDVFIVVRFGLALPRQ